MRTNGSSGSLGFSAGDVVSAERAYRSASALEPGWSVPLYNLGLLCKYQGRWEESVEFNRRASELAPDDQAAWWNRGIAATALGRWKEARSCWEECGIADPGGSDPPNYEFGRTALRLDPDGDGEVVWGSRLDPARALIRDPRGRRGLHAVQCVPPAGHPCGARRFVCRRPLAR